jgi:predicted pyridoxine 5'-phosphate oxidase superfamily flavin-nucleotide-binding protein
MEIGAEIRSFVERCGLFYVGTSDKTGTVHLAIAKEMKVPDNDHVTFDEWFCRRTLENLEENPQITVGAADTRTGKGYQLIGEVEKISLGPVMDGFGGEKEEKWSHYPQARHQLHARVDAILELDTGPHSDDEIE